MPVLYGHSLASQPTVNASATKKDPIARVLIAIAVIAAIVTFAVVAPSCEPIRECGHGYDNGGLDGPGAARDEPLLCY